MFSFLKRKKVVECEHIWEPLRDFVFHSSNASSYCPKCKKESSFSGWRLEEIQERQRIDKEYRKYKEFLTETEIEAEEDWSDF